MDMNMRLKMGIGTGLEMYIPFQSSYAI